MTAAALIVLGAVLLYVGQRMERTAARERAEEGRWPHPLTTATNCRPIRPTPFYDQAEQEAEE